MHIWQPDPGEILLVRTPVTFATGEAMPVSGMRWFRDTERNDIQNELPGWPEGPVYTARSTGNSLARNIGKGGGLALFAVIMGILTGGGGSGPSPSKSGKATSDDRADEIEDFPVMWAAPGTLARTLPWQLDPARTPDQERYRTHAIVTDRRMVIVGLPVHKKDRTIIEDEVLWEAPRSTISQVEPRNFRNERDVKIGFIDGSWCRLSALSRNDLTRYLTPALDLIPLGSLTQAQRDAVDNFLATAHAPDLSEPFVTRLPCGHYRAEALVPSELDAFFGAGSRDLSMNVDGSELEYADYHPEDF
ncbi:hypothetical protein ACFWZ2_18890 [Streptomyces sp. NPDC059002]|uniref:hypothetical protein n=1 Tax=Streptomyces sp. NPDC059002 TaxID=3346690 RepID=UPI0036D14F94